MDPYDDRFLAWNRVMKGEYREWIKIRYPKGADGAMALDGLCEACLRSSDGCHFHERLLEQGIRD